MSKFLTTLSASVLMVMIAPNIFAQESIEVISATSSETIEIVTEPTTAPMQNDTEIVPEVRQQDQCCPVKVVKKCCFPQGLPLDVNNPCDGKYPAAYNAAATVALDRAWDVDVTAAFTYWYATQEGMDVAFVKPVPLVADSTTTQGHLVYSNFGYKPGFKVGLGMDLDFDDWRFDVEYTWYNNKQTNSSTIIDSAYHGNDWSRSSFDSCCVLLEATTLNSSWKLKMDMLDVELGRPFYQGKNLTLSPSGGLRALWIFQDVNINLFTPVVTVAVPTQHFIDFTGRSSSWAIGPKIGVDSHWMFCKGFRIEGTAGASLLYTKYTTNKIHITTEVLSNLNSNNGSVSALRPTLDMGLGLGYGAYTSCKKYYFDLSARYDFMQFWSQNVLREFGSRLGGTNSVVGDLAMHGFTIDLRLDF